MRILHINKITQNLLHFAFDSKSSHARHSFIIVGGYSNRLEINFINFTVETSAIQVQSARKRFVGVHTPDPPDCVHLITEMNMSYNF